MSAFRLAGLLRFRKLQEDQAAADLAVANAARRRAQAQSETADGALRAHDFTSGGDTTDTAAWRSAVATRVALRSMAAEAAAAAEVAVTDAKQREMVWADARTRSVSLEKLEEKHVERATAEDLHTEQVALDEIAGRGTTDPTPGGGA